MCLCMVKLRWEMSKERERGFFRWDEVAAGSRVRKRERERRG